VIPELLRAKVRVFADLHRKTRQLEALNRDLELRVEERTQELEKRAQALEQLNRMLAHKNQELDAIIHTAPDMIFSRQADGKRDYLSDRFYEYTGASQGSAIGYGWMEYVHPDDREQATLHWDRCIEARTNYEAEYRIRSKDGAYRWFRARAVPIRDDQQSIVRWYGTCSDIHDSKLLEQGIRDNAAKLEKMVESRTMELRRLSVRLMTMQDQERRRIARELHDGLGQELAVAKMVLDNTLQQSSSAETGACAEASSIIDRAIQQVRTLSHLLHPPLLDEVGLLSALTWYVDGLSERSGIETSLDVQPPKFPRLASELETAIFRIVQEALTNVFRHSEARRAWITLTQKEGQTLVSVRDDGKGVKERVAELQPDSLGIGIGGIKQRAKELGGELRIANMNPGTQIEVVIPSKACALQEAMLLDGCA
jgi:PAS domain S-box-containing protein